MIPAFIISPALMAVVFYMWESFLYQLREGSLFLAMVILALTGYLAGMALISLIPGATIVGATVFGVTLFVGFQYLCGFFSLYQGLSLYSERTGKQFPIVKRVDALCEHGLGRITQKTQALASGIRNRFSDARIAPVEATQA